jgi:hypothetical protein
MEIYRKMVKDFDIENPIQSILQDQIAKISKAKEDLIFKAFADKVNEPINFIEEMQRRFPRIAKVVDRDQSEHYYWNDGSKDGLRIISFYPTPLEMGNIDNYKFTVGFTYG